MKKLKKGLTGFVLFLFVLGISGFQAEAQEEEETILPGIYIEDMSVEGMTATQAEEMIDGYVSELCTRSIRLVTVNDNEVLITPGDIGFYWSNRGITREAAATGQTGNIVQRYKAEKDLQFQHKVFKLEFEIDRELLRHVLADQCSIYNVEAQNATLTRIDDEFVIQKGQVGCIINEEESINKIGEYLTNGWDGQDAEIELVVTTDDPLGSEEELGRVKDVLGTFSTSFKTSNSSRSANVRNGCELINGTTLYPGEEFSTYNTVAPFTSENGYHMAGSYLNGQVVDSLGGGICQVSTTLYNAVLLSELEVTERHNHSMIVSYVDPSADAAISESAGKDFRFVNNRETPIYIEGYTTEDKQLVFTIYGEEKRPSERRVAYESEVVSKTYPDSEIIYTNEGLPVGSVSVQSAHIGYKANLWKVVYEKEQEVSRELVNSSVYKMVPRTATVGIATEDPNVLSAMMAAVATNNIDYVKGVAAALTAGAEMPAPPASAPEQPAAGEQQPQTMPAPEQPAA